MEILYRAIRVYLWLAFASKPIIVLIRSMNTRRNVASRFKEEISKAVDPPCGERIPPLQEDSNMDHAPVSPPPLTDEVIRTTLLQMAQAITTQAQAATAQDQCMTA